MLPCKRMPPALRQLENRGHDSCVCILGPWEKDRSKQGKAGGVPGGLSPADGKIEIIFQRTRVYRKSIDPASAQRNGLRQTPTGLCGASRLGRRSPVTDVTGEGKSKGGETESPAFVIVVLLTGALFPLQAAAARAGIVAVPRSFFAPREPCQLNILDRQSLPAARL